MKRQHGSGSVVFFRGRYVARLPAAYGRGVIGRFESEAEARRVLSAALQQMAKDPMPAPNKETLATYGSRWLEARQHMRSYGTQTALWSKHIANSEISTIALEDLTRIRLKQWITTLGKTKCHKSEKTLSHQTKIHLVNLVRRCLHEAMNDGIIRNNPALKLEISSPVDVDPGWHYLEPEQQEALLAACNGPEKHIVEFALYSGCRKSELWTLHLDDVHLDDPHPWIWVQYGGRRRGKLQPPKNGRARRVPLLPAAITALRAWLDELKSYTTSSNKEHGNPHGLVFPGRFGEYRDKSRQPSCWRRAVIGIQIGIRWHDLRHTCASSLVAGWWGRTWTLQEVKEILGHSSIKVTERYAHLSAGALAKAAAETLIPIGLVSSVRPHSRSPGNSLSGRLDSNQRLLAPKASALPG